MDLIAISFYSQSYADSISKTVEKDSNNFNVFLQK